MCRHVSDNGHYETISERRLESRSVDHREVICPFLRNNDKD